jgi:hypothetical protein
MNIVISISDLPNVPAVYAMYGGRGGSAYVAYVGIADVLKRRVGQHLIRRDSSAVTGVSAVSLNPDLVTEVRWWEHPDFADRRMLLAAELVAFDILEPALRSRGGITNEARQLYGDAEFKARMNSLFSGGATGQLVISTLQSALERIADLEQRVRSLEQAIREAD